MAVPAHDERDHAFSKKYNLPIIEVISNENSTTPISEAAFVGTGSLINSGKFSGLFSETAKETITEHLVKINKGKREPQYKLRDWLISRQRYWGTPIPMAYDDEGKAHPINEELLPVKLPIDVNFNNKGNPIESSKSFKTVQIKNNTLRRETDTMDTFFDSSWYFLRYLSSKSTKLPFEKSKADHYCPVDFYIGGIEHACLH